MWCRNPAAASANVTADVVVVAVAELAAFVGEQVDQEVFGLSAGELAGRGEALQAVLGLAAGDTGAGVVDGPGVALDRLQVAGDAR